MLKSFVGAALVLGAVLAPTGLWAGEIEYTFNQTIGPGSVTGTLITDGNIGTLSAADIISFNLSLNDGSMSADVSSPTGSAFDNGSDLTASATNLMFNYSGGDGGDFYFLTNNSNFDGELCYTATSNCWGPTGVGLYNVGLDGQSVYIAQSGNQIIASGGVPVPEPITISLFGAGLVALGMARARKNKNRRADAMDVAAMILA